MATKSKEQLEAEVKDLGLNLPKDSKVEDIKTAIKAKKAENKAAEKDAAKEAVETLSDGREPRIADEPDTTFEERTNGVNQPWLNEDGSQNTGE